MTLTAEEKAGCAFANRNCLAITLTFQPIDRNDPNCPIPSRSSRGGEMIVSGGEASIRSARTRSPVSGLVHRYPDRVLFS